MSSSQPAPVLMQNVTECLRGIAERLAAQKQRSAFSLAVSVSHSDDPVGAAINPFGLDTSCAEGHETITISASPLKKMIPPAGLTMHVWRQRDGISVQPILMIEVQDENTGNLYQKFNLEQKPHILTDAAAHESAAIETAVSKWLTKWIKAIDKEIDHRMKTEG